MSNNDSCVIILSTKSSGSSAVQEFVCRFAGAKHVDVTHHAESETLFWTKAASILQRPQHKVPDSEVPIPRRKARSDLLRLLRDNVPEYAIPADPHALVFDGWAALCAKYAPLFVEKSPHHLHQVSCMDLLLEAEQRLPNIRFQYIALIRNPMDVLYSMWCRWATDPERYQHHWAEAYINLRKLEAQVGSRLLVVRYEDLADGERASTRLLTFLGVPVNSEAENFIHGRSIQRWKEDRSYGFHLAPEVEEVARIYGYTPDQLRNIDSASSWWLQRLTSKFSKRYFSARWRGVRRWRIG